MAKASYRFSFFRAGGVDQVVLDEGALGHLDELDEKLWLSLACPTHGLELDARTLDLIDTDHDGRIRPPEVLAAVAWAKDVFADLGDLFESTGSDELPLSVLADTATAKGIRDGAKRILTNLGRPDDDVIRLDDVLDTERVFIETTLNGDGIVPASASRDEATRLAIVDIITVMGAVTDRSGQPGIDRAKADAFFEQAATFAGWLAQADASIEILGKGTLAAVEAMHAVRSKIDDFFMRGRLAAYGGAAAGSLDTSTESVTALEGVDLTPDDSRVARWPLAHPRPGPLSLVDGLNPAWTARMDTFVRAAVTPLLGHSDSPRSLSEAQWLEIQKRLSPYEAWAAAAPELPIGVLGSPRVKELWTSGVKEKVLGLIDEDVALEAESNRLEAVEKAIRLRRDLVTLVRNFINFADFYGRRKSIFQAGTLYIDGRSCDLCLTVHDVAKHATLAGLAKAYLVYCDCTRKGADKRTIVAAVTAGHVDNILVGRNGVFYDRKGDDWDATITKIIENPISVRQAFLSPYKRFVRLIEEQVAKRASAADAKANKALEEHATNLTSTELEHAAAAGPPKKIDIGTVAAIGVAVGGMATFFSSVFATFFGLGMWMPLGLAALLVAVSGPSMIIAYLKLSQRNIGPILDANGWAVNAFARINVRSVARSRRSPSSRRARRGPWTTLLRRSELPISATYCSPLWRLSQWLGELANSTDFCQSIYAAASCSHTSGADGADADFLVARYGAGPT